MFTLFGAAATKWRQAELKDEQGRIVDVDMAGFLEAAAAYREALVALGAGTKLVVSDFDGNYQAVKACLESDPAARATLNSFLQVELSGESARGKLQWLLRGLHFIGTYLDLAFKDVRNPVYAAYEQTLAQYHGRKLQFFFKAALVAMPSKASISQLQALCPGTSDKNLRIQLVSEEAPQFTAAMLPMVELMISRMKKFN